MLPENSSSSSNNELTVSKSVADLDKTNEACFGIHMENSLCQQLAQAQWQESVERERAEIAERALMVYILATTLLLSIQTTTR